MKAGLEHRAASAALWSALEIAARYGTQFGVMIVLARILGPQDFGLLAILMIFTGIGSLLVDSGFGTALIQRQATTKDDETTVFVFSLCIGLTVASVLAISAPLVAEFFDQPRLVGLMRAMALALPLGAFAGVPDALLTMRLDFRARAAAEVVASICSGATAIAMALHGFGVWSLVWLTLLSIGVRGAMLWLLSGWRPHGRFRWASFRSLLGFGGYYLLTGLLNAVADRMQSALIGKLFSVRELGYYTLAQNTHQAPAQLMGHLLNRVGLPVFSTIAKDRTRLRDALRTSLRIAMFLFVPSMVGIALVAKPLISLVYGAQWTPAAPMLSVLALSVAPWPLHVLNLAALGAQGHSRLIFRIGIIKITVGMVFIIGASPLGPLAIAWAVLASSVVSVFVNTHYTRVFLGYGMWTQLVDQSPTIALSLSSAFVGWTILHLSPPGPISTVAGIIATTGVYLTAARLTHSKALRGLLILLRSISPRHATSVPAGLD